MRSYRWLSKPDIDWFENAESEVFLFVYKKHTEPSWEKETEHLQERFEREFPSKALLGIGGALKGEKKSTPLPPTTGTPQRVIAIELGLRYWIETHEVLNPGLFLDQTMNRERLTSQIQTGETLLNLFSYTGAFSVLAASRGVSTTSVDLSRRYLKWSKENFELNALSGENHRFIAEDARVYAKRALKRGEKWDWIILDPPTFSRSDEGVFRVNPDGFDLLAACLPLVKRGVLFSLNDDRVDFGEMTSKIDEIRLKSGVGFRLQTGASHPDTSGMKSLWLLI